MIKRKTTLGVALACLSCQLMAAENVIEPPMVTIPAGEFMMGGGGARTLPIHNVKLKAFNIGKYEVTVREFAQFINATGYKMPSKCRHHPNENWHVPWPIIEGSWDNNELTTSEFQPVGCIGSEGANAYANWLSEVTGKNYRLLSEAEWEYAARAGTDTNFYFGNDPDSTQICHYENIADLTAEQSALQGYGASYLGPLGGVTQCDDKSGFASIVGMYKPNAFGVYDMIGNVTEFVQDCGNNNYQGAPVNGSAWLAGNCERQVVRGSAWHWRGGSVSNRGALPADWIGVIEGFRLALEISDNKDNTASNATTNATRAFEMELVNAQHTEQLVRQKLLPFPTKVSGLKITTENKDGSIRLTWQANPENNITGYHVFRSDFDGAPYHKIASNIEALEFLDNTAPKRKHSYQISAVNPKGMGVGSASVITSDATHSIPGTIQAEDFNHMNGPVVGTINDGEDGKGGLNLTGNKGIQKGHWTEYTINVKASGDYQINYRVASPEGSEGFELLINDKVTSSLTVPKTDGFRKWQTATGEKIHLDKGSYKLRMRSISDGWKLNWLSFKAVSA